MRTDPHRPNLVLALTCLLAILLFLLGIAVPQARLWGSYLLPIVLVFLWGSYSTWRRDIYMVTSLASMLIVVTFGVGITTGGDFLTSHLLPIVVLWAVAWLLAQRRQQQEQLDKQVVNRAAQLEKLFHANPGAIAITRQTDGCYLDANSAYLQLLGFKQDELVGRRGIDLGIISAAARAEIVDRFKRGEAAVPFAVPLRTKTGVTIDVMTAIDTIDFEGEPCYLSFMVDVTAARRLEARANRLAALVDAAHDAIMSADLDGTIVTLNRSAEDLYGTSVAAVAGQKMALLTPPAYVIPLQEKLDCVTQGETMTLDDVAWALPDGSMRSLSIALSPIRDDSGQVTGFASLARDVTARNQLEREVVRLAAIVHSAHEAIISADLDGMVVSMNRAAEDLFGVSAADTLGHAISDIALPQNTAGFQETLRRVGSGEVVTAEDAAWQLPDGLTKFLSVTAFPIRDRAGRAIAFAALARDITARRQIEASLRASEDRYRTLFNQAGDGIFSVDATGRYMEVNDRYCRLLGRTRAEIIGAHIGEMTVGVTPEFFAAVGEQLKQHGTATFERRLRHKDGTFPEVEVTVAPLSGGGRMAIVRDITARKAAERALRDSEARFAKLFGSSPVGIALSCLADGRYLEVNDAFLAMVGYSRDELVGHTSLELGVIDPEDRQRLIAELQAHDCVRGVDLVLRAKGGEQVHTLYAVEPLDVAGVPCLLSSVVDISERKQLEETVTRLAAIVESSSDAIVSTDLQGRIVSWNGSAEQLYGCSVSAAIGRPINELLPPGPDTNEAAIVATVRSGATVPIADRVITKADGTRVDLSIVLSPVKDKQGGLIGVASIVRDITTQKRLEAELQSLVERWSMAAEISSIGIWDWHAGSDEVVWDERMYLLHGLAPATTITFAVWRTLIHPDDRAAVEAHSRKAGTERLRLPVEYRVVLPDGSLRHLLSIGGGIYDAAGMPVRQLGITMDITERKQIEAALRNSEARYRLLVDNAEDVIWAVDVEGRFTFINPAVERQLGYRPEEVIGQRFDRWLTPASAAAAMGMLAATAAQLSAGQRPAAAVFEGEQIRNDGTQIFTQTVGVPLLDEAGRPTGFLGITRDVTERKRAEEQLRLSEEKFARFFAANPAAVCVTRRGDDLYLEVNAAYLELTGYTRAELIGHPYTALGVFPAGYRADLQAVMLAEGRVHNVETQIFGKWGRLIDSLVSVETIEVDGVPCSLTMIVNITKRKRAEAALAASEAQLRAAYQRVQLAADTAGIGIWNWNFADNSLDWDERMCVLYGVTAEERRTGIFYDLWRARVHPDDLALAEPEQGDLTRVPSEWSGAYRILLPGGAVRHIQVSTIMEYDRDGKPHRIIGVNRDITDQVHYERLLQDNNAELEDRVAARTTELQTALAELQRASKLKDEFMAMISHELRTPLTGVLTMSEMLEDQIAGPLNARQATYAKSITQSGKRLLDVVNGILDYTHLLARKTRLQAEPCELAYLLDVCATSQRQKAAAKGQAITVRVAPPELAIVSDATALAEVLKRLLDNAVKFTPTGGQIGLEAHSGATHGTVDLLVWDTGIGIPSDQVRHVFRAFTQVDGTLTRGHEGLGLGLAYVDQMVHLLGGTIALESTPGEGSRFTITLPV